MPTIFNLLVVITLEFTESEPINYYLHFVAIINVIISNIYVVFDLLIIYFYL